MAKPVRSPKTMNDPDPPDPPTVDEPKTGFEIDGDGPILHEKNARATPREVHIELHLRLKIDDQTLTAL